MLITDPARIAAAAPITHERRGANTGNGHDLRGRVRRRRRTRTCATRSTIQFTEREHVFDQRRRQLHVHERLADHASTAGSVAITGAPAAGDTFTVSDNTGGTGDNRNALALCDSLNSKSVLDGGTASLNDATNRLVGSIGVADAARRRPTATRRSVVKQESLDARDSVSGVNLDEEAANLLQATSRPTRPPRRLIRVASTLFDSLLAATSR